MARVDDADFLGWVQANRDGLRKTAFLMCGDWDLADDLVQDGLVRLYGHWRRVASSGDPGPYARKVLMNRYRDLLRRPSGRVEVSRAEVPDTPIDVHYVSEGDRDRLLIALGRLTYAQRAVIVLRYWEDLTVDETAQVLAMNPGTVRSHASRGLATLREALGEQPGVTPWEAS